LILFFSRKWSKNAKFQTISENAETPSRQEMMQFDSFFSRKWSKNAKFQAISENAETPSRQEMMQFDIF